METLRKELTMRKQLVLIIPILGGDDRHDCNSRSEYCKCTTLHHSREVTIQVGNKCNWW